MVLPRLCRTSSGMRSDLRIEIYPLRPLSEMCSRAHPLSLGEVRLAFIRGQNAMDNILRSSQRHTGTESEAARFNEPRLPWLLLIISLIVALDATSLLLTLMAH